jgi:hypothetical protein
MNPSPTPRPERGLPFTQTTPRLHASVVPAVEPGAMQCREKVFTSMVASTSRLADVVASTRVVCDGPVSSRP